MNLKSISRITVNAVTSLMLATPVLAQDTGLPQSSQSNLQVDTLQTWQHSGKPAQLIEMFTSEGCSSCPPADHYLSSFKKDKDLWQSKIPIAYHVDYWDYIGWKDRFANPAFSQRQRLYQVYGATSGVYTPEFVIDGKEWRGFFKRNGPYLPANNNQETGTLTLTHERIGNKQMFHVSFDGDKQGLYTAHIVLLAMSEMSKVTRGENQGRALYHDFVALSKDQKSGHGSWQFDMPQWSNKTDAVAVWLTKDGEFEPVQTVAGMINPS